MFTPGNMMLDAGTSGLVTDIDAFINDNNDDGAWALQFGLGALTGGIGGRLGLKIDSRLQPISISAVRSGHKTMMQFINRGTGRFVANASVGAALGGVQQIATNAIDGKAWHTDVMKSTALGGLAGGVIADFLGAAGDVMRVTRPLAASPARVSSTGVMGSVRTDATDMKLALARGTKPLVLEGVDLQVSSN
ncbi:hypothetical protein AMATHDRAFT_3185 [Amanita thiersii Skay4041]|uniref:Uncharacterized protein n=1 Tax=Amanita thiersii Skay4041 TaxID=703135 RepID=A0A2A9NU93_9AGAR|nr:hypothetical protein AMATHDRAFT_3185 [Amanita thiersii Skay4041]